MFSSLLPRLEATLLAFYRSYSSRLHPTRRGDDVVPQGYAGFGTPQGALLRCRVTLPNGVKTLSAEAPAWENAKNIARRLLSREVSGVPVRVRLGDQSAAGVTDRDGYAALHLGGLRLRAGWHEAEWEAGERRTRCPVLIVEQPEFGVISDLDDTVLISNATSLSAAALTALLNNVRTRSPFPGVGALYRDLCQRDGEDNPMFYISSSPWNFYDLLWRFLHKRDIPAGPLLLRNWREGFTAGHGPHKLTRIREVLREYPGLNFILIGDSGEADPELYAQIAVEQPERVLAVYIRDVRRTPQVQAKVALLQARLRELDIPLVLSPDTAGMRMHAGAMGHLQVGGRS